MSKDPDLEAYVEAIEDHLRARRGAESVLSPRDFALARSWYGAGVPLATVLVGIDRAFETGQDVSSLAYCRRLVEELVASGPRPRMRPPPPVESVPLKEVEGILGALREGLMRLRPGPEACFEPPLKKIQEMLEFISVASRPNWDYLRGKLREIDEAVSDAVLRGLPTAKAQGFRREAAAAVERHRQRVAPEALEDAIRRYTIQRAREELGLPRVGLI